MSRSVQGNCSLTAVRNYNANVIRKVTRPTMVRLYLEFCEEEKFEPLSRATLFRVLEVRKASQQRSVSGLDNTAADGSAGFDKLYRIVDEMGQIGLENSVADKLQSSLQDGKRHLKTEYQSHCQEDESLCPDHCRKLGLSDPKDRDFQEQCVHHHIYASLEKLQRIVKNGCSNFYSTEQQADLLYDNEKA